MAGILVIFPPIPNFPHRLLPLGRLTTQPKAERRRPKGGRGSRPNPYSLIPIRPPTGRYSYKLHWIAWAAVHETDEGP